MDRVRDDNDMLLDGEFPGDPSEGCEVVEPPPAPGPVVRCMADVQPQAVSWLWQSVIPAGKLVIVDGDPSLGKSTLTLDLAARISRGEVMPDGTEGIYGDALLLNAEDGEGDTIRPRLGAADADLDRVHVLSGIRGTSGVERSITLPGDVPVLTQAIRERGIVLVVLDPLVAFLEAEVNANSDADVRRVLHPLAHLADETGATVLGVRHLNKAAGQSALYRGGGSIAFTGAARVVLIVGRDPDDEDVRILATVKNNLAPPQPSQRFRLASAGAVARVEWLGSSDVSSEALVAVRRPNDEAERNALAEAREFLVEELKGGSVPYSELEANAKEAGISKPTLKRAKASLSVRSRKTDYRGGWCWMLPDDAVAS